MNSPTGEHLTITSGDARAVVTTIGAHLRAYEVGGVAYLETYAADENPPLSSGAVLVPWPNRVAGGEWELDGQPQRLEQTEQARGNAIHGLVRDEQWSVVEHSESAITLEVAVGERPGWPFPFHTSITYALGGGGLTITHTVRNTGDRTMPFGVGVHPYPRPGAADADTCVLRLAATTHLPLDPERMVPTGPAIPMAGADYPGPDFTAGAPLRGVTLDDPFGDCLPGADGLVRHRLHGDDGGVEVWADPVFRWVQVFTPKQFPGRDGGRAVAIEPMTCPPDALNSGVDLLHVGPGESWSGSWGIVPLGSGA